MNRAQRRSLIKKYKKKGLKKPDILWYLDGLERHSVEQEIEEDEKVMINVEAIQSARGYETRNADYVAFIENNVGKVFTAHVEPNTLISLKEEPRWLFWKGDLIKTKNKEGNNDESKDEEAE